jgi:hypothetical protein
VPVVHELPGAVDIEEPGAATEQPAPRDTPGGLIVRTGADTLASAEADDRPPAPSRYALRVGQGERLELDAPVLIGRRPVPPRFDSGSLPRLIAVPSPQQEVSSTHVRIEQSGDAVVVTDLRSTNGTRLERPDGTSSRLRPGESAVVLPGTVVEIGDGNIIEITAVPADGSGGTPRSQPGADRRDEGRE